MNNKTKLIVFTALLTAIAVVLKVFLGIPVNFLGTFAKDINFSSAIVIFSGIFLGPLAGGIVGGLTDILAILIRPLGAYIPFFTITNILMGVLPALFYMNGKKNTSFIKLLLVTLIPQAVCSFFLNTLLLMWFYGLPPAVAWLRGISAFICWPLYTVVIFALLKAASKFRLMPAKKSNQVKKQQQ